MNTTIFKDRELRSKILRIGAAESIAALGDWVTMMAVLALLVFRGNGGVAESSGIFLAGLLPIIPGSLIAGKLCDRYDRKKLMIISQLLSAAVVSGLVFTERLEIIYVLLALEGLTISIMTPARQSAIPMLVSKDELTQANAFLQQLSAIVKIGAPMLAGLVLTVVNPHMAILINVATFIISAVILSGLPALKSKQQKLSDDNTGKPIKGGVFDVFRRSPSLKILFLTGFCGVFLIIGFDVLSSVFIRDVMNLDEKFYGFTIGMIGIGTLMVSGMLLMRRKKVNHWLDLITGILLLVVIPLSFTIAIPLAGSPITKFALLGCCLIGGIGNGLIQIQSATLLQTLSPADSLGRVSGAFQSSMVAGQLLGTVLTPILVTSAASMGPYFSASTAALLLLAGFLILQLKRWERANRMVPIHQTEDAIK